MIDGHTHTHTHRQTQATTIPEGHNWPRVKTVGLNAHAHGRFAPNSDGRFVPREYFVFIQHVQKL